MRTHAQAAAGVTDRCSSTFDDLLWALNDAIRAHERDDRLYEAVQKTRTKIRHYVAGLESKGRQKGEARERTVSGIGAAIAARRKEIGMSQLRLAVETGVRQPTICEIERGAREPYRSTVERIAEALGCKAGELGVPLA